MHEVNETKLGNWFTRLRRNEGRLQNVEPLGNFQQNKCLLKTNTDNPREAFTSVNNFIVTISKFFFSTLNLKDNFEFKAIVLGIPFIVLNKKKRVSYTFSFLFSFEEGQLHFNCHQIGQLDGLCHVRIRKTNQFQLRCHHWPRSPRHVLLFALSSRMHST
mgnify:CR=1 FL=1